jgi:hypothetical protein
MNTRENQMMCKSGLSSASLSFVLLLLSGQVPAEEATPPASFTYSDDWALVSAPPPPGPYNAVNIDPRVPGPDALPPLPVGGPSMKTWGGIPAEALTSPPAAGIPAVTTSEEPRAEIPAPATGDYRGQLRPASPAPGYPAQGRYPAQPGYQDYRSGPPSGYYGTPARQPEAEVPPPPVYDALMGKPGGANDGAIHQ